LTINERGKWTDPPPAENGPKDDEGKTARERQDEEIFQTARLIK
jgi:hypothetical protein